MVRKKVKEAKKADEVASNKEEVKKKEQKKAGNSGGRRGGTKPEQRSNSNSLKGFFQTGTPATTHRSWLKTGRQT